MRQQTGSAASVLLGVIFILTLAACGSEEKRPPLGKGMNELATGTQTLDLVARENRPGGLKHLPQIEVTVPEGWFNFDGWAMHKGRKFHSVALSFWDVDQVYGTPCKWRSEPMVDPGRGVADLASALAKQPLRNASAPTDVTLGGFRGKYLRWSVPADIAFDEARRDEALFPDCDDETFHSWTGRGWSGDRYQQAPGQIDRIWILNVNGERLLVDASYLPAAAADDRAELEKVVHSIRSADSGR